MTKKRRTPPEIRRDRGMEVATSHADAVVDNWRYLARAALQRYLRGHFVPFLTQDLILWARDDGLPEPPTKKAWGTVVTNAARHRIIQIDSYTKNGTYNANMKPLWRATDSFRINGSGESEELDVRMGVVREPGDDEELDSIIPLPTPAADDALGVPPGYREAHPAPTPLVDAPAPAPAPEPPAPAPAPCAPAVEPPKPEQGSLF